jgi:dimethylamine monooxygenase subunit C
MLVSGIKSRPVYPGLYLETAAKRHLFLAEDEGVSAVFDLIEKSGAAFLARSTILAVGLDETARQRLLSAGTDAVWTFPSRETALFRFDGMLGTLTMGTRIYVAGTEPFIGLAVSTAMRHGIDHQSLITEHRGSLKRRVQCVHCKGFTEDVTTNPVACAHCGLNLLVRDHYSRRLAAFQGVCIDAEVPGEVPPQEALFK